INKSADSARGDDCATLKPAVVHWLMSARPAPEPALEPSEKTGRGFNHDVTGHLLCPVDYDWSDTEHRSAIRDYHPDFLVTEHNWPTFLYENERYDSESPTKGLFKNKLLVQAFRHVFTSPTSALKMDNEDEDTDAGQLRKRGKYDERRTRSHVAALLGMKSVSPRAIAYIAVQLRFALSSCGSWRIVDGEFNYQKFYNNIVHFFEGADTPEEKSIIERLLLWWNR
ncbi:hypothetical protein PAXRUDRAFT_170574, partial [Paxillus rubicundulus Ve08.2h10]